MQRDIGNEFIVAIIAVGVLAFAVAFAIILSLSGGAGQAATATPRATNVIAQVETQTTVTQQAIEQTAEASSAVTQVVATSTFTSIPASSTSNMEVTATQIPNTSLPNTTVPTATVIKPTSTTKAVQALVASDTARPVTVTPSLSLTKQSTVTQKPSTATLRPTSTSTIPPTIKASATPTQVPPSATSTASQTLAPPTATFTVTASPTRIPPSATVTATVKPSATATKTATPQPTLTPTLRPTFTRTATAIPSATPLPSATATFTSTATQQPSPTPVITATATVVNTVVPCTLPDGWSNYTVRRGDTLLSIAQKAGTTIEVLQAANCLANINNIRVGQILFVPGQTETSFALEGCTDVGTKITNLTIGQLVSGKITVEGIATSNNFAFYKLEIRPDSSKVYTLYNSYIKPVTQGILGEIDTSIFSPGLYWLKLTVITQNNETTVACAVPLLVAAQK